ILDLAGVTPPENIAGRPLSGVLDGSTDEHRELVISGWPLEYQKGRISIAVDSWPRRIAHDQPYTVTARGLSLVVGGPEDDLELYDLVTDPAEESNIALERPDDAIALLEESLRELEAIGTEPTLLEPRRGALARFRAALDSA
nr:hypothetical protein [Actinomycetota bacterium]